MKKYNVFNHGMESRFEKEDMKPVWYAYTLLAITLAVISYAVYLTIKYQDIINSIKLQ